MAYVGVSVIKTDVKISCTKYLNCACRVGEKFIYNINCFDAMLHNLTLSIAFEFRLK